MIMFVRPTKTLSAVGIQKNNTVQTISSNSWTKILGWTIKTDFPDTVIVSDGIQIQNAGSYILSANDVRAAAHSTSQCRILVNNVPIIYSGTPNITIITVTSGEVNLNIGDIVTLESFSNTVGSAAKQVQPSTFLTVTPL